MAIPDARVAPITLPEDDRQPRDTPANMDPRGLSVVVVGLRASGWGAADVLAQRGAIVRAIDSTATPDVRERAVLLQALGGHAHTAISEHTPQVQGLISGADVVVVDDDVAEHEAIAAAHAAGVPVWSPLEVAWRLRAPGAAPWVGIVAEPDRSPGALVACMSAAASTPVMLVGSGTASVVDAVVSPQAPELVVCEAPAMAWHRTTSVAPIASYAPSADGTPGQGRVYENTRVACVYDADETRGDTATLVAEADVVSGARAVGVSAGVPGLSMLGVVDDVLADRAFIADRANTARELGSLDDVEQALADRSPEAVRMCLAAAALAMAAGLPATCVQQGVQVYREKYPNGPA